MRPTNDNGRLQPAVGMDQEKSASLNSAAAVDECKRFATLVARAALIGLEAHRRPSGIAFVYHAFGPVEGYVCTVPDLARAEITLAELEGAFHEALALVREARGAGYGH